MTGFAAYGSLRHVGRAVLLALVVLPVIWVLFIASGTTFGPAIDDPKDFLITLLNGLTAAALYFVVASGFTLIFGLMRVVNMAHGAFYLLAGYIAYEVQQSMTGQGFAIPTTEVSTWEWVAPLLVAAPCIAVVGLVTQQAFLRWNQGQELRQALITIAISVIIADQALAHFGGIAQELAPPSVFPDSVQLHVYGLSYPFFRIFVLLAAMSVLTSDVCGLEAGFVPSSASALYVKSAALQPVGFDVAS